MAKKIFKTILIDIACYAVCMGVFLLFFYLIPYELESDNKIVGDSSVITDNQFSLKTDEDLLPDSHQKPSGNRVNSSDRGNHYDHLGTKDFVSDNEEVQDIFDADIQSSLLEEYESDNVILNIYKNEIGSGRDKITYYVADVQVTSLEHFKTALAKDKYGVNMKDDILSIAKDNDAILAMTGDNYSNSETGIVVRNGVLYREKGNDADVCVLFIDGTMKTYSADEFDAAEIWADGVWQAWCFGPGLLDEDGEILSNFVSTTYLSDKHPRCAIGYIEPGHYILMVVDGRDEGYSCGVTFSELAALMYLEGCVSAYNLDGGGSASMVFDGECVNQSTDREISDAICVIP